MYEEAISQTKIPTISLRDLIQDKIKGRGSDLKVQSTGRIGFALEQLDKKKFGILVFRLSFSLTSKFVFSSSGDRNVSCSGPTDDPPKIKILLPLSATIACP